MISKEKYLKAVSIIEEYHKQVECQIKNIAKKDPTGKTPLNKWHKLPQASTRLRRCLDDSFSDYVGIHKTYPPQFLYIEDVTESEFRKIRGAGAMAWNELQTLLSDT